VHMFEIISGTKLRTIARQEGAESILQGLRPRSLKAAELPAYRPRNVSV
jgi:hypothetical protein